ncbi:MAG TPA: dienelactone hydrolase family protein, partial [Gammaproteobacteria bacterium]|nr:dienelactone hydrolase family protein [Gammaproteobacteria bacterium]
MTLRTTTIDYSQDGKTFEGFLAWDDSRPGARPGVVISHAWGGAGAFEQDRARDLAQLGYAGFCLDLYGKGIRGSNPEENSKLMQPFLADRALLQSRMQLAVEVAREQDQIDASAVAAMGYCFGGLCVLDLARTGADLRGVVSFHGLFAPPGNTAGNKIKAKVLALHGWNDPMVPPEAVAALATELTKADADWQIHGFGHTMHAFTNPQAKDPAHGLAY